MSKSREAYKAAMRDIRKALKQEGKVFTNVSLKQLKQREPIGDYYCSAVKL